MALIIVGLGQNQTISQSETDSVSFLGVGRLDIAGTAAQPITVTLSQVGGAGSLNTIAMSNADVTLNGVAGVSALVNYSLGSGSTLRLASTVGVAAGSTVTFTGPGSTLALGSGVNLGLLNSISGFGPGNTIDVSAVASSVSYTDNAGAGTGGTLTLLGSNGQAVATLPLSTGEYVAGEFQLSPDGAGGTQVKLGAVVTGVSASPMTADVGVGAVVTLSVTSSAPVTVTGGAPTLALNDGGVATYDPTASSGSTMAFKYTVAAGENTADLAVVRTALNGATIAASGGVPLDLSGAVVNPAGVLQVDTTAPTVTGVTTSASGALPSGSMVGIGVGLSEGVTVSGGTPTLMLSDGGTASYDPTGSTPTTLMFMHTVPAGGSGSGLTVTGVMTNGSSITDPAGNVADLSGAVINPNGGVTVPGGGGTGGDTGGDTGGGTGTGTGPGGVGGIGIGGTQGNAPGTLGVYRFFDSGTGTHFFTANVTEKNTLMNPAGSGYRPDLKEEVNNFGAIDPSVADANTETVYRFFDTVHGTHFFTASQAEATSLQNKGASTYRADLTFEPTSSFLEHATQQAGDVAVYRFFDKTYGTHFYTGSQSEYAGITTPGTAAYRADLVSEGVGFYAPAGSYS